MGRCLLCEPSAQINDTDLGDHLRLLHPAALDNPFAVSADVTDPEPLLADAAMAATAVCARCGHPFTIGQPYTTPLVGLTSDAVPVTELTCLPCACGRAR